MRVVDLGLDGATPEKVRVRAAGRSLLRLDRGGPAGTPGDLTDEAADALARAGAVLVADYGRGVARGPRLRAALEALPRRVPLVWDPHPRGPEPVRGAALVTPNGKEAEHFAPGHTGALLTAATARGRELQARWGAIAVSVTLGGRGALVVEGDGPPSVVPAPDVPAPTRAAPATGSPRPPPGCSPTARCRARPWPVPCWPPARSSPPAAPRRCASAPPPPPRPGRPPTPRPSSPGCAPPAAPSSRPAAASTCCTPATSPSCSRPAPSATASSCCSTATTASAGSRAPSRPLQSQTDRADVLRALGCVDAVLVFDEDTPAEALRALRPDVFAKGGDYALTSIPEAAVVAGWGGQAVVLPYLEGRSTTNLIKEAVTRG